MALPKRRTSRSSQGMRRSHLHLKAPATAKCSRCGQLTMPHRACPSCGFYKGRKVIEAAEA